MKSFKELAQDIVNRMEEDAPVNSIAGGGVDMAPNAAVSHSPKMMKRKKEQGDEQEKISKKIGKMVKENDEKIKMGLIEKCMNCHKPLVKTDKITLTVCNCVGHTKDKVSTYWGF